VTGASLYSGVLFAWLITSALTFAVLLGRAAPYGRHARGGWGSSVPPRWGWIAMEAPAPILLAALVMPALCSGDHAQAWLLLGMWELHYVNRAFVFPFRLRSKQGMPLSVVAMAVVFNVTNAWLNAQGLVHPELGRAALSSPRVLVGVALFFAGLVVNWNADARLLRLRREHEGYAIPHGGLYRFVSCPNYLGEIIEWVGFSIAAGSLAALAFACWTVANLAPRARAHHRWYQERFPDYPTERRALVPFVW